MNVMFKSSSGESDSLITAAATHRADSFARRGLFISVQLWFKEPPAKLYISFTAALSAFYVSERQHVDTDTGSAPSEEV